MDSFLSLYGAAELADSAHTLLDESLVLEAHRQIDISGGYRAFVQGSSFGRLRATLGKYMLTCERTWKVL